MLKSLTKLVAVAVMMLVAACTHIHRRHGYIPPADDVAMVQVGQTARDDLPELLGVPSTQGLQAGSAWYYVGSLWEHYGMREPRETSREVLVISFADSGVVSNVERFGLENGRVVVLSRRVTDSNIAGIGLIKQLMGNIGNINASQLFN